jgi:hypothetical protein
MHLPIFQFAHAWIFLTSISSLPSSYQLTRGGQPEQATMRRVETDVLRFTLSLGMAMGTHHLRTRRVNTH